MIALSHLCLFTFYRGLKNHLTIEVFSIVLICNGEIKKTEVAFPLKRLGPHLKECYVSTIFTILKNLLTK